MTRAEALRLLAEAASDGDFAARDEGIALGMKAIDGDAELALQLGRALRARYRSTYSTADIEAAVSVLGDAADRADLVGVWAELARALVQLANQVEIGAVRAESDAGTLRPEDVRAEAARAAERAVAGAAPGTAERLDAAYALGDVRYAEGDLDSAVELLTEASAASPSAQLTLAMALASRSEADSDRARELLIDLAEAGDGVTPRDAFEAARFHGFWASTRDAWAEAGAAYVRALRARTALRRGQGEFVRQRKWLQEAGPIPSQAACALVRSDRPGEAACALDAGLSLNLADRLGAATTDTPPDVAELRRAVAGEPLLYLAFDARGGIAICVPPEGEPVAVQLDATRDEARDRELPYLGAYTDWQRARTPAALRTWMQALDGLLEWLGPAVLEPALELLPAASSRVVLVTDGVLGLVPVHAAPVGGATLLDRVAIRLAPSARVLGWARSRSVRVQPALAVAVPEYPDAPRLEYALTEAEAVAALLDATLLKGPDATRVDLEAALPGAAVAHVACHADARFDDPLESAVFLSGGETLSLARMLDLRLDASLVFLSACETAMEDVGVPEEKFSLATGLLHAGAAGVVGSLWAVSDRSTLLLALRFHELRRDLDSCAALQAAQRWLRDSTGGEISAWLAPRGGELGSLMKDTPPNARPYGLAFHWAAYTYTGA